jgi:hypothetical protein
VGHVAGTWNIALFHFILVFYLIKVVGLERGPLSLVSTIEELLDRKVAVPV